MTEAQRSSWGLGASAPVPWSVDSSKIHGHMPGGLTNLIPKRFSITFSSQLNNYLYKAFWCWIPRKHLIKSNETLMTEKSIPNKLWRGIFFSCLPTCYQRVTGKNSGYTVLCMEKYGKAYADTTEYGQVFICIIYSWPNILVDQILSPSMSRGGFRGRARGPQPPLSSGYQFF